MNHKKYILACLGLLALCFGVNGKNTSTAHTSSTETQYPHNLGNDEQIEWNETVGPKYKNEKHQVFTLYDGGGDSPKTIANDGKQQLNDDVNTKLGGALPWVEKSVKGGMLHWTNQNPGKLKQDEQDFGSQEECLKTYKDWQQLREVCTANGGAIKMSSTSETSPMASNTFTGSCSWSGNSTAITNACNAYGASMSSGSCSIAKIPNNNSICKTGSLNKNIENENQKYISAIYNNKNPLEKKESNIETKRSNDNNTLGSDYVIDLA